MENVLYDKAEDFAVRIDKLCNYLTESTKCRYALIDQIFRCGTSIGANIAEAQSSQSDADMIAKFYVARREANETRFWLRLLLRCGYLEEKLTQSFINDCEEIIKILIASIKTLNFKKQQKAK